MFYRFVDIYMISLYIKITKKSILVYLTQRFLMELMCKEAAAKEEDYALYGCN
jgi:hypothetical protein